MSPTQEFLPGAEPPKIAELDEAARVYVDIRNDRMQLTEQEIEARGVLLGLMIYHKLKLYRVAAGREPLVVTIFDGEPKVKVRKEAPPAGPADMGEAPDGDADV